HRARPRPGAPDQSLLSRCLGPRSVCTGDPLQRSRHGHRGGAVHAARNVDRAFVAAAHPAERGGRLNPAGRRTVVDTKGALLVQERIGPDGSSGSKPWRPTISDQGGETVRIRCSSVAASGALGHWQATSPGMVIRVLPYRAIRGDRGFRVEPLLAAAGS